MGLEELEWFGLMGRFYGQDDKRVQVILAQIVVMQAGYYLALGSIAAAVDTLAGTPVGVSQLFDGDAPSFEGAGIALVFAVWVTSVAVAALLAVTVERAKKCLDFGVTVFILHLVATTIVNAVPRTATWWAVYGSATAAAVVLGEVLCMWFETQDITIEKKKPVSPVMVGAESGTP